MSSAPLSNRLAAALQRFTNATASTARTVAREGAQTLLRGAAPRPTETKARSQAPQGASPAAARFATRAANQSQAINLWNRTAGDSFAAVEHDEAQAPGEHQDAAAGAGEAGDELDFSMFKDEAAPRQPGASASPARPQPRGEASSNLSRLAQAPRAAPAQGSRETATGIRTMRQGLQQLK